MQTEVIAVDKCHKCPLTEVGYTNFPTCEHPDLRYNSDAYRRIITFGKGFHRNCPLKGKKLKHFKDGKMQIVYLRRDEDKHFKKKDSSFSKVSYAI